MKLRKPLLYGLRLILVVFVWLDIRVLWVYLLSGPPIVLVPAETGPGFKMEQVPWTMEDTLYLALLIVLQVAVFLFERKLTSRGKQRPA
jgi:hypothetical protein